MSDTPFLSILTPSYNYAWCVRDALRSVAEQHSLLEVEHVVIDDGSTDDSCEVLGRWPNLRLTCRENRGLSATLNEALSISVGGWIGWLNCDDFYLPHAFDVLVRVSTTDPDIDVIHGDTVFTDREGRLLRLVPQHPVNRSVLRHFGPTIAPCSIFIRRRCLSSFHWDTEMLKLMDLDLYLYLLDRGARFHYVPTPLGAFRRHDKQASAAPTQADERHLIAQRFGLPTSVRGRTWSRRYGAVNHGLRKLRAGGYRRQAQVELAHKDQDLRWFAHTEAYKNVHALIDRATPPRTARLLDRISVQPRKL